ncbi:hypothetical protein AZE42_06819 [Rhizopogon vesiculosus]|uniref:Uncharacterized protein n=1 Tax=Rhizopogon vesiculosus TaxID=180088 RepID=A0A1J8QCA1_9AGAM|nr:hypothetical protein AZE42_06819 [Rhizopogon vesiculosus]
MLEIKEVATEGQIHVAGLSKMVDKYFQAIAQGKELNRRSRWKKLRNMRDWKTGNDKFQLECNRVWKIVHQTSSLVNVEADRRTFRGSIPRSRSLERLDQAEPNLVTGLDQHDNTPAIATPANPLLRSQTSSGTITTSINANEETVRRIAEMAAAKTLELFLQHRILPVTTINNFQGCVVNPGRRTVSTVNFGGQNNKGAGDPLTPTEAADENSSDEGSLRDTTDVD